MLGLSVLCVFVLYYFIFRDIQSKNEHLSAFTHDLSLQMNKEEYLTSTEKKIQNINTDINNINNSIISHSGDVEFIENLESIAHNNNLSINIESLVFEDNPKFAPALVTIFKIKAKTTGGWVGTYRFLNQIESLPFKVKINNYAFISGAEESESSKKIDNVWQSMFEISVLKYK